MANYVLKDAYLNLNSTDQSANLVSLSFPLETATVDNTRMGDDELNFLVGLQNATFAATFAADNADSGLTEDLWGIYDGKAAVAFVIASNGSSISATNPSYSGNCIMTTAPIVDGSVGDKATHSCSFQVTGAVTRSES